MALRFQSGSEFAEKTPRMRQNALVYALYIYKTKEPLCNDWNFLVGSSGRSSPTSMESTPWATTVAPRICNWSASTSTTTRPLVRIYKKNAHAAINTHTTWDMWIYVHGGRGAHRECNYFNGGPRDCVWLLQFPFFSFLRLSITYLCIALKTVHASIFDTL